MNPSPASGARPGVSLTYLIFALLAGHSVGSMAMLVMPAVAPDVARDYGVDPVLIGYQISLVTIGLMFSLLFLGNASRKLGACRTNQIGHIVIAFSMLAMIVPMPSVAIGSSIAIGLGYGLITPSAFALMMRFAPPEKQGLIFSIQQTSVPFGGILAATIGPAIAVTLGWRWALVVSAALLFSAALLMQRGRAHWDDDRDPLTPALAANVYATLAMIWRNRRLRLLALIGTCFSWGQFVVASYTVVACVSTLGLSLIVAGTMLTTVQLGNAGGRVLAGWLADRLGGSQRVIAWLAWLMMGSSIAAYWLSPAWPLPAVYALFAVLGITTGSWAGMVLADIGRWAPPAQISKTMGGALAYVNMGKLVGPAIFANVYLITHSYGFAFATMVVPAAAALYLLHLMKREA